MEMFINNIKEEITIEEHHVSTIVNERDCDQKPHKCDQCPRTLKSQSSLIMHQVRVHKIGGKFVCTECGEKFMTPYQLKNHSIKHSDERSIKCDQCGKRLKSKANLVQHKTNVHATERPFQCEICPKTFPTVSLLHKHVSTHNEEKPYQCDQCSKTFRRQFDLTSHNGLVHATGAKFACEICGKIFMFRFKIKQHLLFAKHTRCAHATDNLYQCEMCLETSATDSLIKQDCTNDNEEKPHECAHCFKIFKTQYGLDHHNDHEHSGALEQHIVEHNERNFRCDICDKKLNGKAHLRIHKSYAHATDTPFQCELCPKSFARAFFLRRHILGHSKEKPFECHVCSKNFKIKGNMDKHIQMAHEIKGAEAFEVVKVEPVKIYDPEIQQVASVTVKEEMDMHIKNEPEEIGGT